MIDRNIMQKVKEAVKKYSDEPILKIENITADSHNKETTSFIIRLKTKKIKAVFFADKNQLNDFLKYIPLIKKAPNIICHSNNIILAEWLEGKFYKENKIPLEGIKKIAFLQAEINKIPVRYNKNNIIRKFNKWFSHLLNYIQKYSSFTKKEIENIQSYYKINFPKNPRISLIHGDVSEDNLILTKRGLYSIDNEAVTVFLTGYDFGKPINSLCKSKEYEEAYLSSYSKILPADFYIKNKDFYQLIYLVKRLVQKLKKHKNADKIYSKIREIIK